MALSTLLSIAIVDDGGNRDTHNIFFAATLTKANIEAFLAQYAPLLDSITGGIIESATITEAVSLPAGLKAAAVADSLKTTGVNAGFTAANTTYRFTTRVPAVSPVLIVSGEFDDSAPAVTNWLAGLRDGLATFSPTDRYANDLTAVLGTELSFRTK